jgi:hypothetical protein
MKLNLNSISKVTSMAIATLGIVFAPGARACSAGPGGAGLHGLGLLAPALQSQSPQPSSMESETAMPENENGEQGYSRIVGMWTVNFYVDSKLWDYAIEQFYADGNEMTNDIGAAPSVGNICWGVWERTGKRTFKLRHIGLAFDTKGNYIGLFKLWATLKVGNHGDTFTGTFIADQEDLSKKNIPDLHWEGTLQADRFKVNSPKEQ